MALAVPSGPYGQPQQPKPEEPMHDGAVSYKHLDSTNISHREIQLLRDQIWRMRHPNAAERERLWPSDLQPKVTELKDIATQRVFQWESDTTWFRAYEVELHQFTGFQFVLDFTGTTNHEIQGTFGVNGSRVEANLQPFELETICLVSRNKLDPFKFSVKMSWTTSDVHPAILQTALAMNEHRIKSEYELMSSAGISQGDDYATLRQKLLQRGIEFVDPDFYPSVGALYQDGDSSTKINEEQVMWRRSMDFCKDPAYFKDGIDPEDVQQGRLGNCWFCCSLASMSERPHLVERLFVSKTGGKEGIHVVNFWHNGVREEIILDDYFPCKPFSGPIYTKTADDEQWVAILEKAYAKIYGCYERLVSGSPYHSLPDLTGNPAEIYELQDDEQLVGLWEKLIAWNLSEDNLMSVACDEGSRLDPTKAGLMNDHSYTILDGKESKRLNVRLLEIRNPWGHGEWTGDWSDFSPLWTQTAKQEFGLTEELDPDDGAFWMCWQDFLNYFTTLTVCYCRRDWQDARCAVNMHFDHASGSLTTNPVRLVVPQGANAEWFGVFQQDLREQGAAPYIDLTALIFREEGGNRTPCGFVGAESARQVFGAFSADSREPLFQQAIPGGTYLIVPFTSGRHWEPDAGQDRQIAISCHCWGGNAGRLQMTPCQEEYTKNELDQCFLDIAMALGEEKKWHDLERRHLRIGQLDLYVGRNNSKNKTLVFSMSGDLDNIYNAINYPDLAQGCAFEMQPQQCAIFGVQVMIDPKQAGSSAYKFGLKSKPFTG
eukprot:85588_1